MHAHVAALAASFLMAAPAALADGFNDIKERNAFVELVDGKKLSRLGIKLDVYPDGKIMGSAFGQKVTGAWRWEDGLFCRDLFYGKRDLGPNCQLVKVRGNTMRFIADRGDGIYADLRLVD